MKNILFPLLRFVLSGIIADVMNLWNGYQFMRHIRSPAPAVNSKEKKINQIARRKKPPQGDFTQELTSSAPYNIHYDL